MSNPIVLVQSMPVELNEEGQPQQTRCFYFDVSECEHKKSNERRNFVFTFDGVKRGKEGKVAHLKVSYSARGNKTKLDEIIKEARKEGISLTEEQLQKVIGAFQRQTEADFFINKDARGFLREQFDLWMYQYIFKEKGVYGFFDYTGAKWQLPALIFLSAVCRTSALNLFMTRCIGRSSHSGAA